jgi:hypothetical protein
MALLTYGKPPCRFGRRLELRAALTAQAQNGWSRQSLVVAGAGGYLFAGYRSQVTMITFTPTAS